MKDKLFEKSLDEVTPFCFDKKVAEVFDDMASRSIPLYASIRNWQVKVVERMYLPHSTIYDIGCSTGNTLIEIRKLFRPFHMVGVDPSQDMLNVCSRKFADLGMEEVELLNEYAQDVDFKNAGVILMNYTLQFIPAQDRLDLLKKLYDALLPGGIFLFSEKVVEPTKMMQDLETDLYYDFKRINGYSELEIAHKREALDQVLVPDTIDAHLLRLKDAGFEEVMLWNKWFNFASFIAVKKASVNDE